MKFGGNGFPAADCFFDGQPRSKAVKNTYQRAGPDGNP